MNEVDKAMCTGTKKNGERCKSYGTRIVVSYGGQDIPIEYVKNIIPGFHDRCYNHTLPEFKKKRSNAKN
jgi:hypothetical protein